MLQIGIRNISDVNVPPAINIIYSNQNELQPIQSKSKHSSKKNSNNLNLSNNISKDNIDSKSQSIKVSTENEDDNLLLKRSSSYKLGEGVTSFKIKNFNENILNELKKSRTYKEEITNGLNFPYPMYNNQQNHLAAVLETINEVSSRVDSSELSDDDENNDANKNSKNNNNKNNDCKIKEGTNDNNYKKEDVYDNKQINESDTAFATKKSSLLLSKIT